MMVPAIAAILKVPAREWAEVLTIWERLEKANAQCEARAKIARYSRRYWWQLEKREMGVLAGL